MIRTILFSSCLKISWLPSTESWVSCSLIVDELLSFTEPMPSFHTILSSKTYHWISSISTCKNIEILVIWFAWYWTPNVMKNVTKIWKSIILVVMVMGFRFFWLHDDICYQNMRIWWKLWPKYENRYGRFWLRLD